MAALKSFLLSQSLVGKLSLVLKFEGKCQEMRQIKLFIIYQVMLNVSSQLRAIINDSWIMYRSTCTRINNFRQHAAQSENSANLLNSGVLLHNSCAVGIVMTNSWQILKNKIKSAKANYKTEVMEEMSSTFRCRISVNTLCILDMRRCLDCVNKNVHFLAY